MERESLGEFVQRRAVEQQKQQPQEPAAPGKSIAPVSARQQERSRVAMRHLMQHHFAAERIERRRKDAADEARQRAVDARMRQRAEAGLRGGAAATATTTPSQQRAFVDANLRTLHQQQTEETRLHTFEGYLSDRSDAVRARREAGGGSDDAASRRDTESDDRSRDVVGQSTGDLIDLDSIETSPDGDGEPR